MIEERSERGALIDAYLRRTRADPKDKSDAWASEEVFQIVQYDPPESAWSFVVDLVRQTPEDLVGDVAAGPLEDLVTRSGAELIDAVETAARREPRVRQALGGIWLRWGALPDAVIERLIRASGNRIKPLPRDPGSGPSRG